MNQWNRMIKRKADESDSSSAGGFIGIQRESEDLNHWERMEKRRADDKVVLRYRRLAGRLGKRAAGKDLEVKI